MNISKNWLRIIGLVLFIAIWAKLDVQRILCVILKNNFEVLGITCILQIFPGLILKSWRWRYLLSMQGIHIRFRESFTVYLRALYLGLITPGRLGEFIKVLYLKEKKKIAIGEGVSNVLVDRFQDILPFVVVGLLGIILSSWEDLYVYYLVIGSTLLFLLILMLLFKAEMWMKFIQGIIRKGVPQKFKDNVDGQFDSFFVGMGKFVNVRIILSILVTVASAGTLFFQCYLIALSLSISISFIYLSFCVSVAALVSLIPISIYGLGTREAALIALFSPIGLSAESAVSFSLMYVIVFGVFTATIGALIWVISPIKVPQKT